MCVRALYLVKCSEKKNKTTSALEVVQTFSAIKIKSHICLHFQLLSKYDVSVEAGFEPGAVDESCRPECASLT